MRSLEQYEGKRNFEVTPEPRADLVEAGGEALSFVVQKHDATRLHYDFRLEWDGVLLSWAVTKGPSADPGQKRLAVRTEDHPLSYGAFEGTIPAGEYGGGTVMLWDQGWWEPLHDPAEGLRAGKLHFTLHGARMKGGWALVRMRGKPRERRENWLLIKERDRFAGRSADGLVKRHRTSVTTGRAMRAIARGESAVPAAGQEGPRPRFRKLQLATLAEAPPEGAEWQHEAKFDGYRCLIALGKGGVRLYSRNGKDWTDRFGALAEPAAALPCDAALIDGEVVAGAGGGDFSALQEALKTGGPLVFYGFDCLHRDGEDLTKRPLSERRAALEELFRGQPARGALRLSPVIAAEGRAALATLCEAGGEGLISKRRDAPYRPGRSRDWIKAKCIRRAEFIIAGWTPSDKRGRDFSSLVLASREGGALVYRGRVGTGFSEAQMEALMTALTPLARKTPPFDAAPPAEARGARWVTPRLVAEVSYAEFTAEGRIRHGVFQGLRSDKSAAEVSASAEARLERAAPEGAGGEGDSPREVAGVRISSPGRLVFPKAGLSKGDVAAYHAMVAERMLDTTADRPLALLRCPDGIPGECFFQKHAGKGFPAGLRVVTVTEKDGRAADYIYVNSAEGLLGAVQMGTLEFHIWGARRDRLERPDRMVFDLDPDEGLGFAPVKAAAQELRAGLAACGLDSVPMVTGGKGVHVIVPLRRTAEWEVVKGFAKTFATILAERAPERYTANLSKAKRRGRIFIDWLRNERGATAVAPYALRARPGAAVAVPVSWEELEDLTRPDGFQIADIPARLEAPCPLDAALPRSIGLSVVEALEEWAGS